MNGLGMTQLGRRKRGDARGVRILTVGREADISHAGWAVTRLLPCRFAVFPSYRRQLRVACPAFLFDAMIAGKPSSQHWNRPPADSASPGPGTRHGIPARFIRSLTRCRHAHSAAPLRPPGRPAGDRLLPTNGLFAHRLWAATGLHSH